MQSASILILLIFSISVSAVPLNHLVYDGTGRTPASIALEDMKRKFNLLSHLSDHTLKSADLTVHRTFRFVQEKDRAHFLHNNNLKKLHDKTKVHGFGGK
ncbi:hypothetical protein OC846_005049 [Tilletia horrida]|uniref:Uncharacterized protein n=1 Tax=Tilletia horrida TaxID=155126 RepID=A0AAN6GLJ2_9BASI|nr:hypothetical protein OC846_005049 [Tilletia horrida]